MLVLGNIEQKMCICRIGTESLKINSAHSRYMFGAFLKDKKQKYGTKWWRRFQIKQELGRMVEEPYTTSIKMYLSLCGRESIIIWQYLMY